MIKLFNIIIFLGVTLMAYFSSEADAITKKNSTSIKKDMSIKAFDEEFLKGISDNSSTIPEEQDRENIQNLQQALVQNPEYAEYKITTMASFEQKLGASTMAYNATNDDGDKIIVYASCIIGSPDSGGIRYQINEIKEDDLEHEDAHTYSPK